MLGVCIIRQDKALGNRYGDLAELVIRFCVIQTNGVVDARIVARQIDAALLQASVDGDKAVLVLSGRDDHVLAAHNDRIANGKLRDIDHVIDVVIIDRQREFCFAVGFGNVVCAEARRDGRIGQRVQIKAFCQRLDALCFLRGLLRLLGAGLLLRFRCVGILLCIRIYLLGRAGTQRQHRYGQQDRQYFFHKSNFLSPRDVPFFRTAVSVTESCNEILLEL